ncbi:aspartic peptidase A1 [Cubamyces menziesii]|nr:aspartic peptidase A1 [Cubamyces menziesii]
MPTAATPVSNNTITLPITKHFNFTGSAGKILQHDQARIRALHARGIASATGTAPPLTPDVGNIPIENALATYNVIIDIGTPPTGSYLLIVDSGSANTWVGAEKPFVHTSTTRELPNSMSVVYGNGAWMSGMEYEDTVVLGSGMTVPGQYFGVASSTYHFEGFDGVLGLGPGDLTIGTLSPDKTSLILTVTDNLYFQDIISSYVLSISFEPPIDGPVVNGELTFGGTDPTKFVREILFAPITTASPSSSYFGVDQGVRYGFETLLSNNPGIFDTGTSLILLAADAFNNYISLAGAEYDSVTTLYRITPEGYENLQSLFFTINGVEFDFIPNAQIWPRSLNTLIGGSNEYVYLIIGNLGTISGSGMDVVLGMMFIERFYTVFDLENRQVGLAATPFTGSITN